jgi:hypothetical protein
MDLNFVLNFVHCKTWCSIVSISLLQCLHMLLFSIPMFARCCLALECPDLALFKSGLLFSILLALFCSC